MNEVMKTKVAEYNAEELLTKRERVRAAAACPFSCMTCQDLRPAHLAACLT
jgi:hypothetical protein